VWRGSSETVAKLARFMCGRAIKPVRPAERAMNLFEIRPSIGFTCNGPDQSRAFNVNRSADYSLGSRKEIARTGTNRRLRSTHRSDDLRHRPNSFVASHGPGELGSQPMSAKVLLSQSQCSYNAAMISRDPRLKPWLASQCAAFGAVNGTDMERHSRNPFPTIPGPDRSRSGPR